MAWGFFKKIVIADTMASYADAVYGNMQQYTGFPLIVATVMFAFQVYCDFSGYSDIAVGTAKLFNIDLMTNFHAPYLSASIKEFWSRWHISLSTWFRDYVYIPLGGNRCEKARNYLNLLTTFTISGLWHGANWTYVIWGIGHGAAQVLENIFTRGKKRKSLKEHFSFGLLLRVIGVFVFCVVTWVFFRASTLGDAIYVFANCFDGLASPVQYIYQGLLKMSLGSAECIEIAIMLMVLIVFDCANMRVNVIQAIEKTKPVVRWAIYIVFVYLILYLVPERAGGEFIYFQF